MVAACRERGLLVNCTQGNIIRLLPPYFRNVGKRLTKAPKVYLRDTGLLHHLLNISTSDELANHPSREASWEGFVIESLITAAGESRRPYFFRTEDGAEIDLVLVKNGRLLGVRTGDKVYVVRASGLDSRQ